MSQVPGHGATSPEPITLDYACSDWRMSSQKAADLYCSGTRLWTREALQDIEHQLTQSYRMKTFSVRRIDGNVVQILNPMFQVQNPIWKASIKYQEYWQLVNNKPDGPTETYLCSYLVDWKNQTGWEFREHIKQPMEVFTEKELMWNNSMIRKDLTKMVKDLLGTKTIKKVICFGLGDFCRTAPEWYKRKHESWNEASDVKEITGSIIQHSMARTIAQTCQVNGIVPSLLTQDPNYTGVAAKILTERGFKVVGPHGAGGFAEVDEDSIVISAFPAAPVKQIIADLTRPALIFTTGFDVFNDSQKPYFDAESPRTREMWLDYDSYSLPSHSDEGEICSTLKGLYLCHRRQKPLDL